MPFSETLRSLNTDQARLPLVGLIIISLLLLAWLAWFFLSPIHLYEISTPVQLPLDAAVVVDFPAESLERIKPGQSAILYLESPEIKLPAKVIDVTFDNERQIQVWLQPRFDASLLSHSQEPIIQRVDIEIDRIAPVTLLKRIYHQDTALLQPILNSAK